MRFALFQIAMLAMATEAINLECQDNEVFDYETPSETLEFSETFNDVFMDGTSQNWPPLK